MGDYMAAMWLWSINLSTGIFEQGIVTGPATPPHTLDAIVGWAILFLLAKPQDWASGDVGDWQLRFRGWILWPALSRLLVDCLTSELGVDDLRSGTSSKSHQPTVKSHPIRLG